MKSKLILLLIVLILPFALTNCGKSGLSPAQEAVKACATFDMISESMLTFDRKSVMSYAAKASEQFENISTMDPQFAKYAKFLKGVSMTGSTLDPDETYSDLVMYCIQINSSE